MPGLFSGIEAAKQALMTHQLRLGVISHNIANAATQGYSRQEAILETTAPSRQSQGYLGTGVTLARIRQNRDPFFDHRAQVERGSLGQYEAQRSGLEQVENVLADVSEVGLGARLSTFWAAWNELANRPTDTAARTNLISAARGLAGSFNSTRADLDAVRTTVRSEIDGTVGEINRLAGEVATLNQSIQQAELDGNEANDLRDRRRLLVEQLADLTGATSTEQADGQVTIHIGGRFLVDGGQTMSLAIEPTADPESAGGPAVWSDGLAINGLAGRLGGLLEVRDGTVVRVIAEFDQLASTLIEQVNALHDDGSGNFKFFKGTGASDIDISDTIAAGPGAVRAGTGSAGDNSIALAVAELEDQNLSALDNLSIDNYLAAAIGRVGTSTREAIDHADNQALVVRQVENVRQSISGVSLDEEGADLIMAQRAFQAAAQVVNTLDSMLETVIMTFAR